MSGNAAEGFAELLGIKNLTKGVKVEIGKEEAAVDLFIVVEYGVEIPKVCDSILQNGLER